jgi:glucokinase
MIPGLSRFLLYSFWEKPNSRPQPDGGLPYAILAPMARDYYIAVDLGGTNIRAALFSPDRPVILDRASVLTEAGRGIEAVLDRIHQTILQVMPEDHGPVCGIGIGAPGPVNPHSGLIIQAPNLPGWFNIPVRDRLEERLKIPVHLGNDANLAGLGEWQFGAGQGTNDLIYMTISTGIGGGIISAGRLLVGVRGLAGEPGHVTIVPDGPVCACGGRGHLEAVASGPAIARRARELLGQDGGSSILPSLCGGDLSRIDAKLVSAAAQQGDELARSIFREAGGYIGRAVADMLTLLNPDLIILGGGVSRAGDLLLDPVRQAARDYAMNPSYLENLRITTAQLRDDAGLFGGYVLARDSHRGWNAAAGPGG